MTAPREEVVAALCVLLRNCDRMAVETLAENHEDLTMAVVTHRLVREYGQSPSARNTSGSEIRAALARLREEKEAK